MGGSIVDPTIKVPATVPPNGHGTASVPDAGPGATYTWELDNGTVLTGAGTPTITFSTGIDPVTVHVTVLTTTGCSKTSSLPLAQVGIIEVPTLTSLGLLALAALLAITGVWVVSRRRRA